MEDLKKIFDEAEVDINDDGYCIVDVVEHLGMTISVKADTKKKARDLAYEWYSSQEQFGFKQEEK